MKKIIEYIEDFWFLIFPYVCESCGVALGKNEPPVCFKCLYELPRTDYCLNQENPIVDLFIGRIKLEKATALFHYYKGSRFKKLLHGLKYKNKPEIGILLGKELGAAMVSSGNFKDVDYIIPVPLHPNRQKQRGYNQSEMIGEGIAAVTGIPMLTDVLLRSVETVTQTKMTRDDRWKNVSGKFIIKNENLIQNKHLLLIDDVVTTGSTLEACGETLLNVDGVKLSIAVLAEA
ncbi:MAG: ComF family protein [Bacteroidales bacterium]|nr:ComF family protein [Bacteroidales bacterium]